MLVEDDPVTAAILTVQLRRNGHLVLSVESAESALSSIAMLGLPDVAVVDVGLPGRDGLALLDQLRRQLCPHPFGAVVISAGPRPESAATLTDRDRFLSKPATSEDLLIAVDEVYRLGHAA